jgi:hypothetical protein
MGSYETIDPILWAWADARGLHVYAGHKQNDVRSITVYLWMGDKHESTGHIWFDPPNELGLVGVHAAAGSFRFDDAVAPERLPDALDALDERLMERKQREHAADQTSISPRM